MSLKSKTIKSLSWSMASQASRQAFQFIIAAILARLLTPQDFGLVGMITVFTGLASILAEMGVGAAIIQRQNLAEEDYSSAFWLSIGISLIITFAMILVAPYIALFYHQPILKSMLWIFSLNFVLAGLATVQQAILMKSMNFRAIAIRDVTAVVVGGVVGIVSAVSGWGSWSLIAQLMAFTAVRTALMWAISPWRPSLYFKWVSIKKIWGFSAHMTGFQIAGFASRNIDFLLIGKLLGAAELGLYALAYKLMLFPLQNISWSIGRVAFPAFSTIQNDLEKVRANYLRMVKAIAAVTLPLMGLIYLTADEFVQLVYGDKWTRAIPLIKILSFCGMMQSISTTCGTVFQSQGRPDLQWKFSIFFAIPSAAAAIYAGLPFGINGIAIAYTIRTVLAVVVEQLLANNLIRLNWKSFYFALKESVLVTTLSILLTQVIFANSMPLQSFAGLFLSKSFFYGAVVLAAAMLLNMLDLRSRLFDLLRKNERHN